MSPLLRAEILGFRDQYPEADSIELRSNGSAEGMEQLVNGEVSMSLLLRELSDPEIEAAVRSQGLQVYPIAWDAISVIVNPASHIEQISRTELASIYRGQTVDWGSLGWRDGHMIVALVPGPRFGVFGYLEQALLGGGSIDEKVYAPPTEEEAVEIVATRRNSIACVSRYRAEQAGGRVRVLRVSEALGLPYVPLNRETLVTKNYPLMRPISIATPARPARTAADFITFTSGMDGQQIVARHGYAPATVPIRIVRAAEEIE